MPPDLHHWTTSAFLCCSNCRAVYWYCPQCGQEQGGKLPEDEPPAIFPVTADFECSRCSAPGTITVLGWSPADALQQSLDLPAAQRPQPPAKSRKNSSSSSSNSSSSNSSQKRLTLREWMKADPSIRRRVQAVNNATRIREAHVRNGCAPTYRGGLCTYSRSELLAALDLISQRGARRG